MIKSKVKVLLHHPRFF